LDEIRREETRELRVAGYEPVLRKARWCLLKRPENLTDRQTTGNRRAKWTHFGVENGPTWFVSAPRGVRG
jgi:hypothetical protein